MYTQLFEPSQISHTQSMVVKIGLTKCSYPYVKKSFKTQHGRIPAILAAIGHRFIAQIFFLNANVRVRNLRHLFGLTETISQIMPSYRIIFTKEINQIKFLIV